MNPHLEIKTSAGRGHGVFATQDIPVGTIILEERPTMIISNLDPSEADVHRAFLKLSEPDQDLFRSLHEGTRHLRTRLARIYHENCFDPTRRMRFFVFPDGRPGTKCIGEEECKRFVRQQCLQPKVRQKARSDLKLFVKEWRQYLQAGERGVAAGLKRGGSDSAVELREHEE